MIKVALKGLAARKVRALLTALAVVIGVSMVSGTFVLTDTMKKAFNGIFEESYEGTDAVIGADGTLPASLVKKVRALDGAEAAAGSLQDFEDNSNPTMLLDQQGEMIGRTGETLGVGYDDGGRQFSPLKLKSGKWAHGDGEVVIDAGTATKHHFKVGDSIRVASTGKATPRTITGLATFGDIDSIGGASIVVLDLESAQRFYGKENRLDEISVKARDGVSPVALTKEIRGILPRGASVQTGEAQAKADAKETNEGLKFITYFLLGFGVIALFVGAFVILNTLSITVAQRSREFATLRTLGASRRQVMRLVVLEGFVTGLAASVLGLVAGLAIAKGLNALFVAFGIDLPKTGMVLASRTVIVSLLLGTLVTLFASLIPALRATRVPPIASVREGAATKRGLGGRIAKPFIWLIGLPFGRLARENAVRNPGRTAASAAALMIGLTLVTVVATLGAGLRGSTADAAKQQVRNVSYVVIPKDGGGTFSKDVDQAIGGASGVRMELVEGDQMLTGYDPRSIGHFYRFNHLRGTTGGAMVTKGYADKHHLTLGSTVKLDRVKARVTGIYDPPSLDPVLGVVSVPHATFDRAYPQGKNMLTFVDADARPALKDFPDALVEDEAGFYESRSRGLKLILSMFYVLLGFSVIVSLFGLVNTLVLAVYERTREIGMLRAIGMTRRQARRMIRQESVITSLIGAAAGIPLGIAIAGGITHLLARYGVTFSLPVAELVVFTVVAVAAGVLAAVIPARRASRVDVLAALQYE